MGDIPTRGSLLLRLRNWEDDVSWRQFYDTYWRLIFNFAKGAGLSDAEAEDVLQETTLTVAQNIRNFAYDPSKGSFKSWLFRIARNRILPHFRKAALERRLMIVPRVQRYRSKAETSTDERVADPAPLELETRWDQEWEFNLKEAAMDRLKKRVNLRHFQIFDLYLQGENLSSIARQLNLRRAHVCLIRHRLTKLLREEMNGLLKHPFK